MIRLIVAGELTVKIGDEELVLKPMNSCCIHSEKIREVKNNVNAVASMLVMMPYPPK